MNFLNYSTIQSHLTDVNDKQLIRLVYISKVDKKSRKSRTLLEDVECDTIPYVKENNIRGRLCNNRKHFIHCIEGTKKSLLALMAIVFKDKRHSKVKVILTNSINTFSFSGWKFHCDCLEDNQTTDISERLIEFHPFTPHHWRTWHAEYFIDILQKSDSPRPVDTIKYNGKQRQMWIQLFFIAMFAFALFYLFVTQVIT